MLKNLKPIMLFAAISVGAVTPNFADTFPSKPIKLVVAYPPGGSTDVVARLVASRLGERLKQPVVIDNKPGASGMLGTEFVARSPADGYTLVLAVADTHSINPHVYKSIRYDAKRDFAPVGTIGYVSFALVVSPSLKATDAPSLVALAKSQPGKLTYSSWGVGSSGHVAMEMLKSHSQIDLLHVPFTGAAPAISAVMSGQVDAMMVPLTLAEPAHKAGRVRILGVAVPKRFSGSPEIPTFSEQGIPLAVPVWLGIQAPAGVPADILNLLNRELLSVLAEPQTRETMVKNGVEPTPESLEATKAFLNAEFDRWGNTIRAGNIKAD